MDRPSLLVASVAVGLLSLPLPASGQGMPDARGPELVSPGGTGRATIAAACPSFSWAPGEWASGYELSVHALVEGGQLSQAPVMRTTLPGRASSWTPSMQECLEPGGTYMWFLREVSPVGEVIGPWSAGLAFVVARPGDGAASPGAGDRRDSASATGDGQAGLAPRDAVMADKPPDTPGNPPSEVPPDSVQEKLDQILAILNDPVSRQACIELGAELEAHLSYGGGLDGEFEGRVGAEGYGNGVMGKVKANPGLDWGANFKGAAVPKVAFCRSFGPILQNSASPAGARMAAAVSGAQMLSDDELTERLMTLVENLGLTESRMAAAMDLMPGFSSDGDIWGSLRSGGVLPRAAEVLPMPDGLRSKLQDPGQFLTNLRDQMRLCQQSNLPPAIDNIVGEFCGLVANEPFRALLNRVDTAISTIQETVDNIIGQLPTSDNCKFFCKSSND